MSVLTFQRKQRALGDIHFCFLSQLAYNSEILSKFVVQFRITPQHIANVCVNWERFRNRLHKIRQKRIKKYTPEWLSLPIRKSN